MILGQVVGQVWATRKDPRLQHRTLLIVRPYGALGLTPPAGHLVAVDLIDAGVGDDVIVCLGSPARWSLGGENLPVDAAVLGIVDRCQIERRACSPEARRPLCFEGGRPPAGTCWVP